MGVIVMEVKRVEKHPNADSLMRYEMAVPGQKTLQIIANQENVYAQGDRVAVALTGATLKDGSKISATKLRGLTSYGMALGKVENSVGSDLTVEYCQAQLKKDAVEMLKWPSIELFHNLRRSLKAVEATPTLTYQAKIKLDGTNAAVQVFSDGTVAAQSRSQVITPQKDNAGFATWLSQHQESFSACARDEHMTIFGEWCGKGIQKRTAISEIDRKIFVVFAIQFGGVKGEVARWIVDPEQISAYVPECSDVYVLPFHGTSMTINFGDEQSLAAAIAQMNQTVAAIEHIDPWVKATFGIEGLGEGLVLYPQTIGLVEKLGYADLLFKAKGEKHQVVKIKKPVQLDPEKVKSIEEFVALFVTPNRLEQGLTEGCSGQLEMSQVGTFLKWISMDVKKESVAELEAAQLIWKDVSKSVTAAAKDWYIAKIKVL